MTLKVGVLTLDNFVGKKSVCITEHVCSGTYVHMLYVHAACTV